MSADRLLGALLRSMQTYGDPREASKLLGASSSLLSTLNNPLNVTLLTSHLLCAPAIWSQPDLRTCMQCLSVYHSAAQALLRHERIQNGEASDEDLARAPLDRMLPKEEWTRAALAGADKHSPRWRHLLVMGGLLLGFGTFEDKLISRTTRTQLENAIVAAANLALEKVGQDEGLRQDCITMVLNHCFPMLSNYSRSKINYDLLLPALTSSTFHSFEGLRSALFLGALNLDVKVNAAGQYHWDERSPSYHHIQNMLSSPLVSALGPMARLIAHSIQTVEDPRLVTTCLDDLETFARTLNAQWKQVRISEVDLLDQDRLVDEYTRRATLPTLWKLLQPILFAAVIILRSAIGRLLSDSALASNRVAPNVADQTLYILRSLYFIKTQRGPAKLSQFDFVYYTTLDVLNAYPRQVESFLVSIKPTTVGNIPAHAVDRNLDLFFLNTAEHFTLILSPHMTDELLVPVLTTYLRAGGTAHLLPIFEAAHSVTLAVFSAPQNAAGAIRHLPLYVSSLFRAFPTNLSARQFRFAFRTLLKLTAPPSLIAVHQPLLPAILLDLLHERAHTASPTAIPPADPTDDPATLDPNAPPLSEQAVVVLALLDGLTQIPLPLLEEWLPMAAELVSNTGDGSPYHPHPASSASASTPQYHGPLLRDPRLRAYCRQHFWRVLVGGEMDPERSRVCHAWWSTAGGREWVVEGVGEDRVEEEREGFFMSGALPERGGSKL